MKDESSRKRENFNLALRSLSEFARDADPANSLHTAGLIKGFEFAYETCWKHLKQRLEGVGLTASSPRAVFKLAFAQGWIDDETLWLSMLEHRNLTVHTYNRELAREIFEAVVARYLPEFQRLESVPDGE
jgi:nucleotidyltransferase substrate binding protein (TIGR01987 family)